MDIRPLKTISSLLLAGLFVFSACSDSGKQPVPPQQQEVDKPPIGSVTTPSAGHDEQTGAGTTLLPRILSNTVLPVTPKKGDELTVKAIAAEHRAGQVEFVYRWAVNGAAVAGAYGPTLKMPLVKGDRVSVTIIPEVAGMQGQQLVRTAVIGNSPPAVQNTFLDSAVLKNHFTARISANDPDGDPLTYRLLKGPKTLVVNENTGEVSWDFQPSDAGTHQVSISVRDSDNAEVILNVPLRLASGDVTERK